MFSENLVSLRYTATGSHIGEEHNGIKPTKKRGEWTGAGNFITDKETGKIQQWWKDWDKNQSKYSYISTIPLNYSIMDLKLTGHLVWSQLGWSRWSTEEDRVDFV